MPSTFLELIESLPDDPGGGSQARRFGDRNRQAFQEAAQLITRTLEGDRYAMLRFQEAMSTSDFPLLVGDVLDRAMVANYTEMTVDTLAIVDQRRVRDFRAAKRFAVDGAEGAFDKVKERAEYPEGKVAEAVDQFLVEKYGKRLSLSWEMFVNDDLDAFRDFPARLGKGARRTEARFITGLYIGGANGLHGSLFDGDNTLSGNPTLSTDTLETALTNLATQVDADGDPIVIDGAVLVVPPALETTARRILETAEYRIGGSDTGPVQIIRGNGLRKNLTLVVDPYIPIVAEANGTTLWAVFASPSSGRPALELDRLIGHEQPEIWVRQPDAMRVGGGTVGPNSGSFDTDSIDYRGRHVIGGGRRVNTGGKKAVVGSRGTGS